MSRSFSGNTSLRCDVGETDDVSLWLMSSLNVVVGLAIESVVEPDLIEAEPSSVGLSNDLEDV
jgi:hypothetical protein